MTAEPMEYEPVATLDAAPAEVPMIRRTAEEKAHILARLTIQLAALGNHGERNDGNA
jgi:hypothetical protein